MLFREIILDTDICIKLGCSEKYPYLKSIIPILGETVYIHRYVYEHEILDPKSAKDQIDDLLATDKLKIVDTSNFSDVETRLYQETIQHLNRFMGDKNNPRKNQGEVVSLAYAKVRSIPIFATDERNLQSIIDIALNTGLSDIRCIRIIDIIKNIKAGSLPDLRRKDAKLLWRLSGKCIDEFDRKIWPIE
jgi:hypothetical protein